MRWGVLGTGYWAGVTHSAAIAASPDDELVGTWGRDLAKAEKAAATWGGRAYADLDELFADVDAVTISLPPHIQPALAIRAAQAGKHLLLEKPIALDVKSADALTEAIARSGVASVVFFSLRFYAPITRWLGGAVHAGPWQGGHGRWLGGGTFDPGSPWAPSVWRREHGALWDLTPHLLSLVVPALGEVETVTADRGPSDLVHLLLAHESGASSSLSVAQDLAPAVSATDLELFGAPGRSAMPPYDEAVVVQTFQAAMRELKVSVISDVASPVDVRLGRHIVAVIEAAQESLESSTDKRVSVTD